MKNENKPERQKNEKVDLILATNRFIEHFLRMLEIYEKKEEN
jgi:hypothetical protein